jgi:hypothetical protein
VETQHGQLAEVVFTGTSMARAGVIPVDIVDTAPRLPAATPRAAAIAARSGA